MQQPIFGQIAINQRIALEQKVPMQEVSAQQKSEHGKREKKELVAAD
jgi:hypothetical protein